MLLKLVVISLLILKIKSAAIMDVTSTADEESEEAFVSRGIFTKYCGPEQLQINTNVTNKVVRAIDECCQIHDECPDYISTLEDYHRYPELDRRPIPFSKMHCDCDNQFLACLAHINSVFARSMRQVYIAVQQKCFQYEYPVQKCIQSSSLLLLRPRCAAYLVDVHALKRWQWFDIPIKEANEFPQIYFAD